MPQMRRGDLPLKGRLVKLGHSRIVAGALSAVAFGALAVPVGPNVPPAEYGFPNSLTEVFLSGSPSVDLALTKILAQICDAETLDTYRTDAGGKTYYLWTCEMTHFGFSSGQTKIAIHKNSGSSSDGVVALAAGTPMAYLQVSDLDTSASQCAVSPTIVPATPTFPSYKLFECGTSAGAAGIGTLSMPSRFGFADTEPKQYSSTAPSSLSTSYAMTIVVGVPVTLRLRNALQTAQGLVAGDETEAGMPSLTSAQVAAIFTGKFSDWSSLGVRVGADNAIYAVRRSWDSGATGVFDATFITDLCIPGASAMSSGSTLDSRTVSAQCTNTASGGSRLLQAGTGDDMAACLSSFDKNGAVGAIGYLSTDYVPGASDGYRWIKVDGYSPKLLNVVDGKWKAWSEASMNYQSASPPTGDDLSFYGFIKAASASSALISGIDSSLSQTTSGKWTGGVMGVLPNRHNVAGWGLVPGASLTLPRTDASVLAYPANPASRTPGSGYDLCAVPLPQAGYQAQ
jgi:hypothetical protein